jgi:hypothetical protein
LCHSSHHAYIIKRSDDLALLAYNFRFDPRTPERQRRATRPDLRARHALLTEALASFTLLRTLSLTSGSRPSVTSRKRKIGVQQDSHLGRSRPCDGRLLDVQTRTGSPANPRLSLRLNRRAGQATRRPTR